MNHHQFIEMNKELEDFCTLSIDLKYVGDYSYNCMWEYLLEKYGKEGIVSFLAERKHPQRALYQLISKVFDPDKVILDEELKGKKIGFISREGIITLDPDMSLEEKTEALFHELLHFHPDYLKYTLAIFECKCGRVNPFRFSPYRVEDIELMISADAKNTICQHPKLVNHLIKKLRWDNQGNV